MSPLIVFSHLRWNFVWQRPQHLLSRLARHHRVLFVEEPVAGDGPARFERTAVAPNVEVLRAHTPVQAPGFHDDQLAVLAPLLAQALRDDAIEDCIAWFYTPAALPLLDVLRPRAVVYDGMGEAAAMREREGALLDRAQLVLACGPGLYDARRGRHPNVLCLPNAVDAPHFAPEAALARHEAMLRAEALQGRIAGPRLGFFGVIDERFDAALLDTLAAAEPAWQFVMVGPTARIDPATLPQRANIHWLGAQPYELLPQLVAGWDVCLLPFAMNAATRFINPTQTLEYLAAEKPVVSTAIGDVVSLHGDVVRIGADAPAFLAACHAALDETIYNRTQRLNASLASVSRRSWDDAADAVREALAALPASERDTVPIERPTATVAAALSPAGVRQVHHIVIGAGATGLAAARRLAQGGDARDTLLIEREAAPGGWCRSVTTQGFTFDQGGRVMFSNEPEVLDLYEALLGDNLHWQTLQTGVHGSAQPAPPGAGALDPAAQAMRPGARFGYPLVGGLQALTDALRAQWHGELALNTRVLQVSPEARRVRLDDGRSLHYDTLVSTMALPQLVTACGDEMPHELQQVARALRAASLRCVQLGVVREHVSDALWIRYPEGSAVFERVFMQTNASPHCSPPGAFGLVCEIGYGPDRPLPCDGHALIARVRADCVKVGLLRDGDTLLLAQQIDLPGACVLDDAERAQHVAALRDWFAERGIVLAGRYGEWSADEAEHPFIAGRRAAEQALAASNALPLAAKAS